MEQRKARMDRSSMIWNTEMSKSRVEEVIKQAELLIDDPQRKERKEKQLCKCCFYASARIGGAAMTTRPCMSCEKEQMYGSTATDVLCMVCAKEGELCKQCGADVDLRVRRRNWPEPKV